MTFTRPVLGPKVYLTRGPSGHNETFKREAADIALDNFLGNRKKIAIDGFIRKMLLEQRGEGWPDVIAYLGDFVKSDPDGLPIDVVVAFWAQVCARRDADKAAKAAALTGAN